MPFLDVIVLREFSANFPGRARRILAPLSRRRTYRIHILANLYLILISRLDDSSAHPFVPSMRLTSEVNAAGSRTMKIDSQHFSRGTRRDAGLSPAMVEPLPCGL